MYRLMFMGTHCLQLVMARALMFNLNKVFLVKTGDFSQVLLKYSLILSCKCSLLQKMASLKISDVLKFNFTGLNFCNATFIYLTSCISVTAPTVPTRGRNFKAPHDSITIHRATIRFLIDYLCILMHLGFFCTH